MNKRELKELLDLLKKYKPEVEGLIGLDKTIGMVEATLVEAENLLDNSIRDDCEN